MSTGSFQNFARKVRNPHISVYTRRSALRSCVRKYCQAEGQSFAAMNALLDARFGVYSIQPPEEMSLLAALNALEITRNQVLEVRRSFAMLRARQKQRGIRVSRREDVKAFHESILRIKSVDGMLPESEALKWKHIMAILETPRRNDLPRQVVPKERS